MSYPDKVFWFDLETSGTDEKKHGITQIYCAAELDGELDAGLNVYVRPNENLEITDEALDVTGFTRERIRNDHEPESVAYRKLHNFFNHYVDKRNPGDKFFVGGYKVEFDIDFINEFWERNRVEKDWLGCYLMRNRPLDPFYTANILAASGVIDYTDDLKLETVADYFLEFSEDLDWHDAKTDILATRELFKHFKSQISQSFEEASR